MVRKRMQVISVGRGVVCQMKEGRCKVMHDVRDGIGVVCEDFTGVVQPKPMVIWLRKIGGRPCVGDHLSTMRPPLAETPAA
jgi:hypothetical protein